MMSMFDLDGARKKKTIYFVLFIIAALSASVVLSAMAAEKATVVINYNGSKERAEQVLEEVKWARS